MNRREMITGVSGLAAIPLLGAVRHQRMSGQSLAEIANAALSVGFYSVGQQWRQRAAVRFVNTHDGIVTYAKRVTCNPSDLCKSCYVLGIQAANHLSNRCQDIPGPLVATFLNHPRPHVDAQWEGNKIVIRAYHNFAVERLSMEKHGIEECK